jgi:hypothetical protein
MIQRKFGPHIFESSREDKVFFAGAGVTKGDVIAYYEKVSETMLPYLKERPLTLQRFPDGVESEGFIQQKAAGYFPDWIPRITIPKKGGKITHAAADKKADLAIWPTRESSPFTPCFRGPIRSKPRIKLFSTSIRRRRAVLTECAKRPLRSGTSSMNWG